MTTPELPPLLPCPFCGGATSPRLWGGGLEDPCREITVVCDANAGGCGAASGWNRDHDKAISAWNHRTALATLTAEVESAKKDAELWRYVRHHWSNCQMHWNRDAANSLKSMVLTIKTAHKAAHADDIERELRAAITAANEGEPQ